MGQAHLTCLLRSILKISSILLKMDNWPKTMGDSTNLSIKLLLLFRQSAQIWKIWPKIICEVKLRQTWILLSQPPSSPLIWSSNLQISRGLRISRNSNKLLWLHSRKNCHRLEVKVLKAEEFLVLNHHPKASARQLVIHSHLDHRPRNVVQLSIKARLAAK